MIQWHWFQRLVCGWRGHHWYCDRILDNPTIMRRFYHWTCLTCPKQTITDLEHRSTIVLGNPSDELDAACPANGRFLYWSKR